MGNKIQSEYRNDEDFSRNLDAYYKASAKMTEAKKEMSDALSSIFDYLGYTNDNTPGTVRYKDDKYEITLKQKVNKSVDANGLMDYARQNRIPVSKLQELFRFKLEIKAKEFKNASSEDKDGFIPFITTSYGTPDKTIELISKEE